jgi:hypothetical protein
MFKSEKGFSLVELAVAAAAAVTIGAIAVTAATGTSAVISSKARAGKTTADSYNSSVVANPDVAVVTAPTFINLVSNSSFTSGVTGWNGTFVNNYADTTIFRTAPASLYTYYDVTNDIIPVVSYNQSNALTVGQTYSLSLWIRNPNVARTFYIQFGNNVMTTASLAASSSWQYVKFENVVANSTNLNIFIQANSGDILNAFNIDDVTVVQGATAQ